MEFYQTYKEELIPILSNCFKKLKRIGCSQIDSMRHLYLIMKTRQTHFKKKKKNYRPMYLNIDVKILNKNVSKLNQQCIKWVTHLDPFGFTLGSQGWFNMHESINVLLPGG